VLVKANDRRVMPTHLLRMMEFLVMFRKATVEFHGFHD
jgi:hypothetical protein